jgi:hypothetical protein
MTTEVIEKLDQIATILRLAHRDAIDRTREAIRSDKVNAAILDGTTQWVGAGKLVKAVRRRRRTGRCSCESPTSSPTGFSTSAAAVGRPNTRRAV